MALILFQFPGLAKVQCAFSGRSQYAGGIGNLSFQDDQATALASRKKLLERLRASGLEAIAECRQVHGDVILMDPVPSPFLNVAMSCEKADGMVTATPGLGLMIKTADCQPVLIADNSGRHIMALHIGWRGNRINFPASAVQRFCKQKNLRPQDLLAVRGPSLGHAEFVNFDEEWGGEFESFYNPQSRSVDLWQLTRAQLERAGLLPEHIYQIDICTAGNHDSFFSWRRDKTAARQAGIIWIKPD